MTFRCCKIYGIGGVAVWSELLGESIEKAFVYIISIACMYHCMWVTACQLKIPQKQENESIMINQHTSPSNL